MVLGLISCSRSSKSRIYVHVELINTAYIINNFKRLSSLFTAENQFYGVCTLLWPMKSASLRKPSVGFNGPD